MSLVWIATLSLGGIGAISAIILYFVAQKFKVYEDPRNGQVEAVLPGANCGGCGYPGCGGFAAACVKADSLDGMLCPVGGAPVMAKIAAILGKEAGEVTPKVAVVRCNGTCANRKKTSHYDGAKTCAIEASLYSGETGCSYGCLGNGDCENACAFGAIRINPETRLPEVDEALCTACGACVKACPKGIIELRNKGPKSRRMYVSCVNKDKGAVARKACSAACQRMSFRRYYRGQQRCLHRLSEMPLVPQVRSRMPHRSHTRRELPAPQTGRAESRCRRSKAHHAASRSAPDAR